MTKREFWGHAKEGIVKGIFWSIGVTIGFAIVSTFIVAILSQVDTVPVIGNFVAQVVTQTEKSLGSR